MQVCTLLHLGEQNRGEHPRPATCAVTVTPRVHGGLCPRPTLEPQRKPWRGSEWGSGAGGELPPGGGSVCGPGGPAPGGRRSVSESRRALHLPFGRACVSDTSVKEFKTPQRPQSNTCSKREKKILTHRLLTVSSSSEFTLSLVHLFSLSSFSRSGCMGISVKHVIVMRHVLAIVFAL